MQKHTGCIIFLNGMIFNQDKRDEIKKDYNNHIYVSNKVGGTNPVYAAAVKSIKNAVVFKAGFLLFVYCCPCCY